MSNLNSLFDVLAGVIPHGKSALEGNFKQKTGESPILREGMIAKVEDDTAGNPVVSKLTSANVGTTTLPDYAWLVIQGMDQTDAVVADRVTCMLLKSGIVAKIPTAASFAVGDLACASSGVLAKVTAAQYAIGQIIEVNSSAGYVILST